MFLPLSRRKWKLSTASTTVDRIRKHLITDLGSPDIPSVTRELLQRYLEQKAADGCSFSSLLLQLVAPSARRSSALGFTRHLPSGRTRSPPPLQPGRDAFYSARPCHSIPTSSDARAGATDPSSSFSPRAVDCSLGSVLGGCARVRSSLSCGSISLAITGRASDLPRQARSAQERTLETNRRLVLDNTESHDPMAATEPILRSGRVGVSLCKVLNSACWDRSSFQTL